MITHLPTDNVTMVKISVGRVLETASNPFWVSGLFLRLITVVLKKHQKM
jgi:hypothetical protein